jgi:hypothetical protein
MLVIEANGKKGIRVPVCWEEVNTRLFQDIAKGWELEKPIKERDRLKLFSIMTGFELAGIRKSKEEQLLLDLYQVTAFVYNQEMTFKEDKPPYLIKLRGKVWSVPKKLDGMCFEQNLHIRTAIRKCTWLEESISFALALYMQPIVEGREFDYEAAKELEQEILELPIWQTYGPGFFLCSKLRPSGISGLRYLNQTLKAKVTQFAVRLQRWRMQRALSRSVTSAGLMRMGVSTDSSQAKYAKKGLTM